MVWSLSLEPVGQEQYNAGSLAPFLFSRGNEFINNGLGSVDEVTKLRFPEHEGIGAFDGIAILETQGCVLAEQTVIDPQPGLILGHVHQRQPLLTIDSVVEDSVALNKRSPAGILAYQANGGALHQEGAQGEEFAKAPVNVTAARHFATLFQQRLEFGVHGKARGIVGVGFTNERKNRRVHSCGVGFAGCFIATLGLGALHIRNRSGVVRYHRDSAGVNSMGLLESIFQQALEIALGSL